VALKTPQSDSNISTWFASSSRWRSRYASAPRKAVLLVGPEHDAHGAARTQVQLLHEAKRFPRHDATPPSSVDSRPDVPGVEVAADDDDLVGPLASAQLADHVEQSGVGEELRVHFQKDAWE
jgi:hypothetical protein